MKRSHKYRITVEHTGTPLENTPLHEPLTFEAENHDDIFEIVNRLSRTSGYEANEATALALGLKLFTEVMLAHRDDALFTPLRDPIRQFIGQLKERNKQAVQE